MGFINIGTSLLNDHFFNADVHKNSCQHAKRWYRKVYLKSGYTLLATLLGKEKLRVQNDFKQYQEGKFSSSYF